VGEPTEFGSYVVYEQLGVGGMASVHVAESRSGGGFRKRLALKRLLPHAAEDPDLVRSFIDEARLVRYLKHANIAQTYDFGKVGNVYFMAMELVPGPTLTQLVRQTSATIGVIPFPVTMNLLIQVLDALDHAHNCRDENGKPLGIIHRDVSPPNIIVSNTGVVKLIDFGVAKAASSSMQTQVGTVKGKFSYMAPEYLGGKLDHRVDLWAVGAIAHELLTNRRLFEADDDFKVIDMVRSAKISPPSRYNEDVPPDLDAVVMTALERDPARRWQTAAAMRTALANAAAELQTVVTNAQLIEWVEWTFSQKPPGAGSELSQLIKILEVPSRPSARRLQPHEPTIQARRSTPLPVEGAERTTKPAKGSKKDARREAKEAKADAKKQAEAKKEAKADAKRDAKASAKNDAKASAKNEARASAKNEARASRDSKPASRDSKPAKKRAFFTPRVGAAMVDRHKGGRAGTLLFLLLLAVIAVAISAWFWGQPFDLQKMIG
jgi:serine/threonine-protein kinase